MEGVNVRDDALSATDAVQLIWSGDANLFAIVRLSLAVTLAATLLAAVLGMPLGAFAALVRFPGRELLVVVLNALMGLPPVVVGLVVFLLLSRAGPLGEFGLLFTPTAMVVAQTVLITPIVAALTRQVIEDLWAEYREEFQAMQVGPWPASVPCYGMPASRWSPFCSLASAAQRPKSAPSLLSAATSTASRA